MTMAPEAPTTHGGIGSSPRRKEDAHLVTGQTAWTDNLAPVGTLHLAFVRSPMAHARIGSIDASAAEDMPNVLGVFTGDDFADECATLPCAWPVTPDMVQPLHPPIARHKVRFAGDPVAVVVARDRASAVDAAETVVVDYDPLPAVVDLERALTDEVVLHEDEGTNKAFFFSMPTGADVDETFAKADVVVKRRFLQQRLLPTPIEPRAVLCIPQAAAGDFTLYSSTQIPHVLRTMLSIVTGMPEHKLRVVAPDVGGGFGAKLQVTGEEVVAVLVAKRLGRPVKWTETRSETNLTMHHGRGQIQDIEIAATREGKLLGLKVDLLADMGAYLMLVTPGVPILGAFMFPAIYKMDAYRFQCTGVFTSKTPTDAYRGAGRPEATFAIERIMDELAVELDMDPLELRRMNWIRHEEFPFETVAGLTYDSGNYEAATDRAVELFDYDGLRREQEERRQRGDTVQLGIGISTFTEMCGLAPSRVLGQLDYGAGGWEAATVRMLPSGKVQVVTGSSPHGQGHETTLSQIASSALGVPYEDIEVLHGDTQVAPMGMDTYGSRSLVVGGIALQRAATKVVDKARRVAAHLLEASEDDLEFESGRFSVRGTPSSGTTIQEVALAVFAAHDYPEDMEPDLTGHAVYDPTNFSYPHGTHLCAVEVDTETGRPTIRTYVAVDDVGKVINPQIVEGQVHGGLAQGIAQALYEGVVYDDDGNLVTGTLVDYLVPAAPDLPEFTTDRTETPADNDLGVKGVGEAGTIASTPAVVNAIVDAVRHLGVADVEMPCTPERVWRAIQDAQEGAQR
ncbi:MAG TPA: xanthine dehydrogenase family protein molybdopterin-binding subunit [Acidimicrobiales bacterium]|nr:xanthine dehydrogenase family protein molybdopterin-binding subunit [Acidimicrobiales bacterium]